eukprot:COSAG01_NODE_2472_length_7625_cov_9.664895_2_plen_112_part_00
MLLALWLRAGVLAVRRSCHIGDAAAGPPPLAAAGCWLPGVGRVRPRRRGGGAARRQAVMAGWAQKKAGEHTLRNVTTPLCNLYVQKIVQGFKRALRATTISMTPYFMHCKR